MQERGQQQQVQGLRKTGDDPEGKWRTGFRQEEGHLGRGQTLLFPTQKGF